MHISPVSIKVALVLTGLCVGPRLTAQSTPIDRPPPRTIEVSGTFYQNENESLFFQCGSRHYDEAWWVRFGSAVPLDRIC